jgi:hypothetical protein
MTLTDNDLLAPAALMISCCFPAKRGWETHTAGTDAEARIHRQLGVGRVPRGVALAGAKDHLLGGESDLLASRK